MKLTHVENQPHIAEEYLAMYKTKRKINIRKLSQPAFTCSKLTIETLEQGMKYVQS